MTMLTIPTHVKEQARARAREVLGGSAVFQSMPLDDQKSIYLSLVQEYIDTATGNGKGKGNGAPTARAMATDSGGDMGYKGYDPGFQGDTQSFKDLVDSVDFPKF